MLFLFIPFKVINYLSYIAIGDFGIESGLNLLNNEVDDVSPMLNLCNFVYIFNLRWSLHAIDGPNKARHSMTVNINANPPKLQEISSDR